AVGAVGAEEREHTAAPGSIVGIVMGVDRNSSVIALHDQTYVKVMPTTRVQAGGRTMPVSELRPGDGVAVWPSGGSNITDTTTLPRGDAPPVSAIKADYIEVTRIAS